MGIQIKKLYNNRYKKLAIIVVLVVAGVSVFYLRPASATFLGNAGAAFWGDTSTGRVRGSAYTFGSPGSFGTSFRPATAPSASAIQFVVNKSSPTRNEKAVGYQLNNGRLYVGQCTGTCSALANLNANLWFTTAVGTNVVTRVFDIAYEQTSGRMMVVYAGNQTGYLFYCIYDGSTWGPVSSCAPTVGANSIALTDGTTTLGTPGWVRLASQGEQFGAVRSNNILLGVQDTSKKIMTISWDGSSWNTSDLKVLTTTGGASVYTTADSAQNSPAFDVGWESVSGMEMAVYANGTAMNYVTSNAYNSVGTYWGSATTISTLASAAQWIRVAADPLSNRMSMIVAYGSTSTVGSNATSVPYIWKTDGSTVGWTSYTSTTGQDANQSVSTAWEKSHSGTPQAFFSSTYSSSNQQAATTTWTQAGGLTTWTALGTNSGNILVSDELTPSPNSDIMAIFSDDERGYLRARTYSGSAWGSQITTNLSTTSIDTKTGNSRNQVYIQKPYQFSFTPYATWSQNWRIYSDYGNTGNPTVPLANEDTTATVQPNAIVRLRMAYAELGGGAEGDTRKKLQFSSGTGCPDSITCTWTDVTTSSIWKYSTAGGLADNTAVPSTTLDSATTTGWSVTNGTSAAASGASQTAGSVQEYDYTLQNNGATIGTTYYFRGYDFGPSLSGGSMTNLNPIYREQIFSTSGVEQTKCTNGTTLQTCTYPSIYAYSTAPQAPTIYVPTNGSTNTSSTPTIQLSSGDSLGNYVKYVIEWCPTNSWPCPSGGGSFDQTASQTGWSNQDAGSGTGYNTNANPSLSTVGVYTVSAGVFLPNTQYYIRARGYDPVLLLYGSYSSTVGFTTSNLNVQINGNTNITGNTIIAN